jgi:hypothetical protein
MFTKIYLALLGISILVILTITFLCYSQLQSMGFAPTQIVEYFESYDGFYKTALWISSIALLILGNVILWMSKKSWALWVTFVYFAAFILLDMWWLGDLLVAYKKQNNLLSGSFQFGGIFAALMVVIVGIGIFFNQFIVLRLHEKMFNKPVEETEIVPTETENVE